MILGDNIKNLVILIPNEAHEPTNQPKGSVAPCKSTVPSSRCCCNSGNHCYMSFNGDVDHDHKITQSGGGKSASAGFESGDFTFNTPSSINHF